MSQTDLLKQYTAYVPQLVIKDLLSEGADSSHSAPFETALLFADISGFTSLTEQLAEQGPDGVEQLTRILNSYFGRMIESIYSHGGDIIKFAGDALLAVWPAIDGAELEDCTNMALQCGLAVQRTLRAYSATDGTKLSLKVAVSTGALRRYHIGGEMGRHEFTVTGPALYSAGTVGAECEPDTVVCDMASWESVGEKFIGQVLSDKTILISDAHEKVMLAKPAALEFSDEVGAQLKTYIPAAVHSRRLTNQGIWLGDLRRVTVLFINLPDLVIETTTESAQAAMKAMQLALYRYEGSVNKLSVDDKGVSMLAALGLPPLSHNNDPTRATLAAIDIKKRLNELGWKCSIGISSGRVFCGTIGNDRRREYTLMGDTVNMAARLMQAAGDGILCDTNTFLSAEEQIEFTPVGALNLKGKAAPVATFKPKGRIAVENISHEDDDEHFIGRAKECMKLSTALVELQNNKSSVAIINGEAGIGKTSLSIEFRHIAKKQSISNLRGFASAIESTSPYFLWSEILAQLFNFEGASVSRTRRAIALDYLKDSPELQMLLPLLSDMLSLDLPDNDITSQISGEARADNINDFVVQLLQESAKQQPLLLTVENGQWVDSASWALLRLVVRDVQPLMLVIATRPIEEPLPKTYRYFISSPDTLRIDLQPMPDDECLALVCELFGADTLPDVVEELIIAKSEGNPFYVEQLARRLLETETIVIKEGRCELTQGIKNLDDFNLPDTLEGLITERIDRLTAAQQLVLKIASVIGHLFKFTLLEEVFPLEEETDKLGQYMEDLVRLELVVLTSSESDPVYAFRQYLTEEVVYNMLLYSQRDELHNAVANWYEYNHPENLAPYFSLLVYHYSKMGDDEKTLEYCVRAGDQAVYTFANVEALGFFEQALELDRKLGGPTTNDERGKWHLQIGEVSYSLANFTQSRENLQIALSLMGQPAELGKAALAAALLKEIIQQSRQRLRPKKYIGSRMGDAQLLLAAARAYERLAQIAYMGDDKPVVLYAALRSLNLSEQAGTSPECARCYSNVCVVASMIPNYKLAELYFSLARNMAKQTGNLACQAYVYMVTAIYRTTTGHWKDIDESIKPGIEIAERIGDRRRWDELMFTLAPAIYRQGRHVKSVGLFEELYQSGLRRGIVQIQCWGLSGLLYSQLPTGDVSAIEQKLKALPTDELNTGDKVLISGLLAQASWQRGDEQSARAYADTTVEIVRGSDTVAQYVLEGLTGASDVLLSLWENDQALKVVMKGPVKVLCKGLNAYARTNLIGLPSALRCQGRAAWLCGSKSKARKLWRKGLRKAIELDMRYEQAMMHFEIGRHGDDEEAVKHLHQARDSFDIAGAEVNYQRVSTLLSDC